MTLIKLTNNIDLFSKYMRGVLGGRVSASPTKGRGVKRTPKSWIKPLIARDTAMTTG